MSIEKPNTQGIHLYSHSDDFRSHWIRYMLAEKQVAYQLIFSDYDDEDVQDLSPYHSLPILLEQNVKLYHCASIAEYIDDRYRQHKLYADHPAQRAEQRQYIWRLESDWFHLLHDLQRQHDAQHAFKQETLQHFSHTLIALTPLFQHFPYFLSEQFSILDCVFAPILLRLKAYHVDLPQPHCRPILQYAQRIFQRTAFRQSLTLQEQNRYQSYL
ncbi:MAG: starvation protein A [Acinetobacter sp.]|nr:starvation protein A [Acinetobacter sp.]